MSQLTEFIQALAVLGVVGLLIALAVHLMRNTTPDDLQDTLDDIDDDTTDRIDQAGDSVSDDSADAADQRVRDTADELGVDTGGGVGKPDTTVDEWSDGWDNVSAESAIREANGNSDDIIRDIDFDEDV